MLITNDVMKALTECSSLAPLHNPPNIIGINACKALMPNTPMTGVFDTAFHQTMPDYAYMYALPYEYYEKYSIRRYGFHGTSHRYVSMEAAKMQAKPYNELKLITCHLGNGSSIAAVKNGKSVDTSMGFTPLEGLIMGTRCGDLDPAIIEYLVSTTGMSVGEVNSILNKKSGLLGLSCLSSDSRDLEEAAKQGNKKAQLALNVFYYRVKKYIGAYAAAMGGVDAVIFTAGIGENSAYAREIICSGMEFLGIKIDLEKNTIRGKAVDISSQDANVRTLVIPTDEELMIALDTQEIVESL
jgi:acetate kinase